MKTDIKKSIEVFILLTCHLKFRIFFLLWQAPEKKLKDLEKENVTCRKIKRSWKKWWQGP